jgi:hypothetical protein
MSSNRSKRTKRRLQVGCCAVLLLLPAVLQAAHAQASFGILLTYRAEGSGMGLGAVLERRLLVSKAPVQLFARGEASNVLPRTERTVRLDAATTVRQRGFDAAVGGGVTITLAPVVLHAGLSGGYEHRWATVEQAGFSPAVHAPVQRDAASKYAAGFAGVRLMRLHRVVPYAEYQRVWYVDSTAFRGRSGRVRIGILIQP